MEAKLYILTQDREFEKVVELSAGQTLTFGRGTDTDVVLPRGSVSRKHAQITTTNGQFIVQDLGSTNGVVVNGKRIQEQILSNEDKLMMGEFMMLFQMEGEGAAGAPPSAPSEQPASPPLEPAGPITQGAQLPSQEIPTPATSSGAPPTAPPPLPSKPASDDQPAAGGTPEVTSFDVMHMKQRQYEMTGDETYRDDEYVKIRKTIHDILIDRMDLHNINVLDLQDHDLRERTARTIEQIIIDVEDQIPKQFDRRRLHKDVLDEALGLGPLEDLLADPSISEVMVNHKDQVYIERKGGLIQTDKRFISDQHVRSVIERIVAPLGRRIDESSPMVDARLKDGSRVNAIIPPLAIKGSSITIRKFSDTPLQVDDLIGFGTLTEQMASFLKLAVESRQNMVISGGTGSGKTTLLNVLSSFIGFDERIVTVEDAAELQLRQPHVVSLEARPPNIEGKGAVTIRDLVKNCLRMRPDRIIVGECRSGEALDMLQAMNTGHDGSMTTGHANTPRDLLARLETMVMMAGMELPIKAIREQVSAAVNMIVQQSRLGDGTRKIIEIAEVTGTEGDIITLQTIFEYRQTGFDEQGKVQGYYLATGIIPKFVEEMRQRGIEFPLEMFQGIALE